MDLVGLGLTSLMTLLRAPAAVAAGLEQLDCSLKFVPIMWRSTHKLPVWASNGRPSLKSRASAVGPAGTEK